MLSNNIIKIIKYFVLALVVLVPLIYFPTGMFPFQIIKTTVFQALVAIIFLLWLFLAIFYKEFRPKITFLFAAVITFFVVVTLSVIFGTDWRLGLWADEQRTLGLVTLGHFVALFVALSSLREKINWQKIWITSFITSVVVSIIAVIGYWYPSFIPDSIFLTVLKNQARAGSTFNNSAFMAGYLLFNFFIGIWLVWLEAIKAKGQEVIKNKKFWGLLVGIILILVSIFLSQTLGVALGLIVGLLALLFYFVFLGDDTGQKDSIIKKVRIASIGILIVVVLFAIVFVSTRQSVFWQKVPILSRVANVSFESISVRDRLLTWQIGLKAFQEKPILGWGFENFRFAFNKNYNPKVLTESMVGTYWDKPHNVLLEYLVNAGVLGLAFYLAIFVAIFYALIKKFKEKKEFTILIFGSAIIAYFVQNLFVFDTIGTYLMFFLFLGFIDNNFSSRLLFSFSDSFSGKINSNLIGKKSLNVGKVNLVQKIVLVIFLAAGAYWAYFNYQIFSVSRHEYRGVNYFLNQMPEKSLESFEKAVELGGPYKDDVYKNFANTVKQAYQQGIVFPNLPGLQAELNGYLKEVINHHPSDFFNYISLAEFNNVFYTFNPQYLEEAEEFSEKALELSPKRQQIYYVLAKTRLLQGDIEGAYNIFEETVQLNPGAADPHFYFGLMAYGLGDYKKGREEIAKSEELGRIPVKVEELVALGNFAGDYDKDFQKAIYYYQKALNISDKINQPNVLLKLAVAYYLSGDYENSRIYFLNLASRIDITKIPIYPQLVPVFQELKINL